MRNALYNSHFGRRMWALYEIEYQYFAPEYDNRGHRTAPGYIVLHKVAVVALEWRGRDGRLQSKSYFGGWQKDLDTLAMEQLRNELDEYGWLYDHLEAKASV